MLVNKLKLISCCFTLLCLLACTETGNNSTATVKIESSSDLKYSITTFADFENEKYLSGEVFANDLVDVPVDYKGFVLLTINGQRKYPLIIGHENVHIKFAGTQIRPEILEGDENLFFYDFYSQYNHLKALSKHFATTLAQTPQSDPAYQELKAQLDSVALMTTELTDGLPNEKYPVTSAIFQAMLLEDSSGDVKTLDELHQKQKAFTQFAADNYEFIANSEQLASLIRQSFMMLEYINYHDYSNIIVDSKTRSAEAKALNKAEMLNLVEMWIEALKPYLPENKILAQCANNYLGRGMVSKGSEIINAFPDIAKCNDGSLKEITFPGYFWLLKGDGVSKLSSSDFKTERIVALVDEDCVFSKIKAIELGRELEQSPMPIFILSKQKATTTKLALDRLCVKDLYFIEDKTQFPEALLNQHTYPYFYKLDANNKVIESWD